MHSGSKVQYLEVVNVDEGSNKFINEKAKISIEIIVYGVFLGKEIALGRVRKASLGAHFS